MAMRGSLGRRLVTTTGITSSCKQTLVSSSAFSTYSSGGGSGRGRGRGDSSVPPITPFTARTIGNPIDEDAQIECPNDSAPIPSGIGHGRGKPISSNPTIPSFSSLMPGVNASAGRGRSIQEQKQPPPISPQQKSQSGVSKKPIFFCRDDFLEPIQQLQDGNVEAKGLPSSLSTSMPGAGRGKPGKFKEKEKVVIEENRHTRPCADGKKRESVAARSTSSGPKMNRQDAINKAMKILSEGGKGKKRENRPLRRKIRQFDDEDDDDLGAVMNLGDNADGERLAKRLGPEMMDKLTEAFNEMSYRVLPSPADDAYLDALHTNNLIEYEPEYLMGDFETNPDIDDTPPIPLREALEKMKPFLMVYEGIGSQEEWEEIIEELMERVPTMKELIDIYSGPDRVTAKQQQQEIERVAKTLPDNAPSSVKRFTDRAVTSLQSNPGWGFDKKCQFMDKLVWEVSQQYK